MFHITAAENIPKRQAGYDPWQRVRTDLMQSVFKMYFVSSKHFCEWKHYRMKNRTVFLQ